MTVSQLKELYLARQSCREFSAKPVAKEQLEEICALAGLAPSACNLQPWKVLAVTGKKLSEVIDCLKKRGKAPFIDNVPAMLVVAEDTSGSEGSNPPLSYFRALRRGRIYFASGARRRGRGFSLLYFGLAGRRNVKGGSLFARKAFRSLRRGVGLCGGRLRNPPQKA